MRRFLFDTGIASDYINRRHGVFQRAHDFGRQRHELEVALVLVRRVLQPAVRGQLRRIDLSCIA